ncbi:Gpi-c transferase complex [Apiospora kogelbergensis]|uniref:Gpi-c transferase complex n=1 Tax=Apiospora kogelbergensis TaxID=1337665 RepID=A0AAW0R689_9PEZI
MLTAAPHLHVRRPSPTTAEFTVSTYPPHPTLTQRLLLVLVGTLRVVLALGAGMLLYAAWWTQLSPSAYEQSNIWLLPAAQHEFLLYGTALGRGAADVAARAPAWALVPLCLGALYAAVKRIHVEERLLVLRGLGIQTRSTPATVLLGWLGWLGSRGGGGANNNGGGGPTRFIPTEKIRDVLINEAFWGFGVRYILVVVVEGEEGARRRLPEAAAAPRGRRGGLAWAKGVSVRRRRDRWRRAAAGEEAEVQGYQATLDRGRQDVAGVGYGRERGRGSGRVMTSRNVITNNI